MIDVASGLRTKGERLGHSQISIWRTWCVAGARGETKIEDIEDQPEDMEEITMPADLFEKACEIVVPAAPPVALVYDADATDNDNAPGAPSSIALLYPTSLCSSEVAKVAAKQINQLLRDEASDEATVVPQVVALAHTEGCGSMGKQLDANYNNVLVGHVTHPSVGTALFLEHGCEKRHNNSVQVRNFSFVLSRSSEFGTMIVNTCIKLMLTLPIHPVGPASTPWHQSV